MRGLATQGYQMPDAPAARYRVALRALADYVKNAFAGKSFPQISPARHAASSAGERGQCLTFWYATVTVPPGGHFDFGVGNLICAQHWPFSEVGKSRSMSSPFRVK
jgi:hypothetical protein